MGKNLTSDEIVTQGHKRYYYQRNGAAPNNPVLYAGQDGQYMNIESATNPRSSITAINVQNPKKVKSFRRVGSEVASVDFPSWTVNFLQKHGAIPRSLYNIHDCITTFYELVTTCKDPSSLIRGFTDYVKIYANGQNETGEEGGGSFDSDSMVQDDLDFKGTKIYPVGSLSFGEKATTEVTQEVVDIIYGSRVQCGKCGPSDDGTKLIYALTDGVASSTGSLPTVYYSTDGGATWSSTPVTTALATDTAVSIDVVGQQLMVTVSDATTGGYYLSEINRLTGVPGSWSAKVTTGFVSSSQPQDVYVGSPREVYFAGNGGYIYKSTNILQGVSVLDAGNATSNDLNRIDGFEDTLVSVGDSNTVIYSLNRGETWQTTSNNPGTANLTSVEVMGPFLWWSGNADGEVYYTDTQGEAAWTQQNLPVSAAGTVANISDINFATDEVGYITAETSDPTAILFVTFNGGADWDKASGSDINDGRVIGTITTSDRWNRIAYPDVDNFGVASNNVALGGLAGDGSDGIILMGISEVQG